MNRSADVDYDAPIIIEIPSREEEPIPSNDWFRSQERVVKGWGDRAKVYRKMHTIAVKHYQRRNKIAGVLVTIFPGGSAAVSMVHTIMPIGLTGLILGAFSTFYAFAIMIVNGAYIKRSHPEKIARHDSSVKSYDSLIREIEDQLSRPRHLRDPYCEFSISIKNQQAMLDTMSLSDLPTYITNKFLSNKITKYVENDIEICSDVSQEMARSNATHSIDVANLEDVNSDIEMGDRGDRGDHYSTREHHTGDKQRTSEQVKYSLSDSLRHMSMPVGDLHGNNSGALSGNNISNTLHGNKPGNTLPSGLIRSQTRTIKQLPIPVPGEIRRQRNSKRSLQTVTNKYIIPMSRLKVDSSMSRRLSEPSMRPAVDVIDGVENKQPAPFTSTLQEKFNKRLKDLGASK
jgi:hypothetical protein